ncbi:MAG: hypothetical protein MJY90_01985 [Bacteroidaceae bacterium]|nr:hypothetical protein [Bacteroidaceae bacterium]
MQQKYYYRDGVVIYHDAAVHHGGGILNYHDVTVKNHLHAAVVCWHRFL